jgi:histone-lysine N-methyltransferase SUV39H
LDNIYQQHEVQVLSLQVYYREISERQINKLLLRPKFLIVETVFPLFDALEYRTVQALHTAMYERKQDIPRVLEENRIELTKMSYFIQLELLNRRQLRDYIGRIQESEPNITLLIENIFDFAVPEAFTYTNSCVLSSELQAANTIPDEGCPCAKLCKLKANKNCCKKKGEIVVECGPSCSCDDSCTNRKYQRTAKDLSLCIFKTEHKGFGLKTLKSIEKGKYLFEYAGEVITEQESKLLSSKFMFDLTTEWTIDAKSYGNLSRFINHSCDSNIIIKPIKTSGCKLSRLCFETARRIAPDEELTINYNYDHANEKCFCGSRNCAGIINSG